MEPKKSLSKINFFDDISRAYLQMIDISDEKDEMKESLNVLLSKAFKDFYIKQNAMIVKCEYKIDSAILNDLPKWFLTEFTENGMISLPIEISAQKHFSVLIRTDSISRTLAEMFLQSIIFIIANNNDKGDVIFKCADKKKHGLSYGSFISLITKNKFFGKKLYLNDFDISELIGDLETIATNNITHLKGTTTSVYEYNRANSKKLPVSIVSFCDVDELGCGNELKQLSEIINNSANTGISTIFLTENKNSEINKILNDNSIIFEFENGVPYIVNKGLKLPISIKEKFTNEDIKELEIKFNKVERIDTQFDSFYDVNAFNYFSMDSTNKLVIPFAFDENKEIVNLEIGGEAPPHALLSGSTGSGKSVLLHTLIEQTILNYHPDDVEIWAIDYKAVEFGCYILNKPPHITVIGQDNSEEFSLSLIDLIQKEYNRRKELFIKNRVKDLEAFRRILGKHSMTRILIVIDEFHNLTQAIQNCNGEKNYKIILENLLREMRAMGMSFLFCSQTIAAGLNGLTEAARNQIGCRLSMRHEDVSEIRETLSLSLNSDVDMDDILNLHKGQVVYKKAIDAGTENKNAYEFKKLNVLFISDETRKVILNNINNYIDDNYTKRDEIVCKNNNRYCVIDKARHPISKFINNSTFLKPELLTLFPSAPTTLEDSFSIQLDEEAGNNLLIIGENDELRESIVVHTVLGALMDTSNKVVASILDVENSDNIRLYSELKQIKSERLLINYGFEEVSSCIKSLKKIKSSSNGKTVYIWYGLNKLKNLIFLNEQDNEDLQNTQSTFSANDSPLTAMQQVLAQINGTTTETHFERMDEKLSFEDYKMILKRFAEYGPENSQYNISVYNTMKGMKKAGIVKLDDYEYRIGLQMSTDDSYDLFGTSSFIAKADDKTAVFYNGSKTPKTIRPYLMPDKLFIKQYNENMERENG